MELRHIHFSQKNRRERNKSKKKNFFLSHHMSYVPYLFRQWTGSGRKHTTLYLISDEEHGALNSHTHSLAHTHHTYSSYSCTTLASEGQDNDLVSHPNEYTCYVCYRSCSIFISSFHCCIIVNKSCVISLKEKAFDEHKKGKKNLWTKFQ